ncbi:TPA: Tn3 family transposase [Escherichia coli]
MSRRHIFTERQRAALFDLPTDELSLLKFYTLGDDDLENIRQRRRPENRIGFALQLCALRYPGRALAPGEMIPREVLSFVGAQLGVPADALLTYATRRQTRQQHMDTLREIYGYKTFTGRGARDLREWTFGQAEDARSNEDLAHRFIVRCRETSTILPAVSTIERLCADALVAAERRIETRIAENLTADVRDHLDKLLSEMLAGNISRFIWLRNFEVGNNSAAANRLLDRLEFLRTLNINHSALASIPAHRIARLRRQGERYFTDGLRDITSDRRWAILAVCVVEWEAAIADAIVETHDRIVGKTWREAKRQHDETISGSKATLTDTIRTFTALGASLLEARSDGTPLEMAVASSVAWDRLAQLVATGTQLSNTLADEPLAYVGQGYHRFRRYAPRMLRCLKLEAAPVAGPLVAAALSIGEMKGVASPERRFLRPSSKWNRHLRAQEKGDTRLWEVAVLFHLRDAFRSGDVWLAHSRRYGDLKQVLVPMIAAQENAKLAVPSNPQDWLADRKARLAQGKLPMSRVWGMGTSASSDGQFFPTARHGEAMNMVNAKYGSVPGLKAYTHVSDQFAPFACQSIPATVSEAPYILDGLLMNEVGRHVREQYADTAGFTDHLFGASSLLGYNLVLRIRDLPSKRLYVFNPDTTPRELRKLVGGKAREDLIVANWPDIFRCAATMTAGKIRPSQLLRKLASYPRQNNLAVALREVGRIERTLFIIEWILDTDMQRRAQIGLNKGEAHHALKNALRIGRQGEIRDRTTEGQHYRIAGLNLLTAVIIYWNTVHLGHAVTERRNEGLDVPPEFLPHISPLGWAHILLTGEYLWPKEPKA